MKPNPGIVARIYPGYRLIVDGKEYATVVGSNKMRGKYYYILKDAQGKKTSLDREDLLALQKDGTIAVIGAAESPCPDEGVLK